MEITYPTTKVPKKFYYFTQTWITILTAYQAYMFMWAAEHNDTFLLIWCPLNIVLNIFLINMSNKAHARVIQAYKNLDIAVANYINAYKDHEAAIKECESWKH